MITLTTPPTVKSVLGSATTVAYGKLIIGPFTMDPILQTVSGAVRMVSTVDATMQPIIGTFRFSVPTSELVIEVPQLDFFRRLSLTSPQTTAVLANIETGQKAIEDGLITLAVVAGTRSAGV